MVATDLAESFRAGLSPGLAHARRVADPFHVVRVGNRCVDQVRRRVARRPYTWKSTTAKVPAIRGGPNE